MKFPLRYDRGRDLFIYLNSVQVPVQETFCQLTVKKKKKKKYG